MKKTVLKIAQIKDGYFVINENNVRLNHYPFESKKEAKKHLLEWEENANDFAEYCY